MAYDARWSKRWRYDRDRGLPRYIPAGPVQMHVLSLLGQGMSLRSIATAAGTSPSGIYHIKNGDHTRVQRRVAAAVLAVQGPADLLARTDATDESFVPKRGAVRRIQALMALGWRHQDMQAVCGVTTSVTLNQSGPYITVRNHKRIAAMFEQLCMTPGPSEQTRLRAARRGYVPPLLWDDIDNDLLPAVDEPDPTVRTNRVLHLDDVDELETQGYSLEQIGERLGVTRSAIEHARIRASRKAEAQGQETAA